MVTGSTTAPGGSCSTASSSSSSSARRTSGSNSTDALRSTTTTPAKEDRRVRTFRGSRGSTASGRNMLTTSSCSSITSASRTRSSFVRAAFGCSTAALLLSPQHSVLVNADSAAGTTPGGAAAAGLQQPGSQFMAKQGQQGDPIDGANPNREIPITDANAALLGGDNIKGGAAPAGGSAPSPPVDNGQQSTSVMTNTTEGPLTFDQVALKQQYDREMKADVDKHHIEVIERDLPSYKINNGVNEGKTGFPFEKDHEFPGGFYVDTVIRTEKDRWTIYKGHVFGTTDYWDLCVVYVQRVDPNFVGSMPKVDCGFLRPVVSRELVQNPSDVYPNEAPYCVLLSEKEDTWYQGKQYRYSAWQFFQRVPKFQPSFRPRETFESGQLPGVKYRFEKFLGRGTYGEAYLGIRLTDNRPVVIKVLSANPKTSAHTDKGPQVVFDKPKQLLPGSTKSERDACNLSQELFAQISDKSKSRFVACLEGDGWITHSSGVELLYAIWEYGGSSIEQDPPRTLSDALIIMKSVLEAIQIIVRKGDIVHRDIKIPNIVWDANKIVRLIDYSLSRRMRSSMQHGNRCYHTQRYNRTKMLLETLNEKFRGEGRAWELGWHRAISEWPDFFRLRDAICEQEKFGSALEKQVEKATGDFHCRVRVRQPTLYSKESPHLDPQTEASITKKSPVVFRWGLWCEEYGYVVEHFGEYFGIHEFDEWADDDFALPQLQNGRLVTVVTEDQLGSDALKKDAKKNEITCANGLDHWFADWPHQEILNSLQAKGKDERDVGAYLATLPEVQEEARNKHTHCISWTAEAAPNEVKSYMVEFDEQDPRSFDVHSLGVVMSHLLRDQFEDYHDSTLYQFIASMVEQMTEIDVAKRMTVEEGLAKLSFVQTYYDSRERGLTGRNLITSLHRNWVGDRNYSGSTSGTSDSADSRSTAPSGGAAGGPTTGTGAAGGAAGLYGSKAHEQL
ncbi:unnamed protein product [Amoebophrya sp. A120]|nr:unnamed protein product [Amoebophrya sp. A120]|eukprot:GSA120T00010098001.1